MTGTYRFSRRKLLHFVIWATIATSYYLYVTEQSMIANIGGFTLHITDLLVAIIAIYCLVGASARWRGSAELILLLLCSLLLLSFLRGVVEGYGNTAGVEFRGTAVFVALVFFVYFWGPALNIEWIYNKIVLLGWAIVALAVARHILGLTAFILKSLPPSYEFRSLDSDAALTLGQAILITTNRTLLEPRIIKRWFNGVTTIIFATLLVLSQQRTAIFSMIGGLAIITVFAPPRIRSKSFVMGILVFIGGAIIFFAAWIDLGSDGLAEYLPNSVAMIIGQEKTFGARVGAWDAYLLAFSSWPTFEQLAGRPYGIPIFAILAESMASVAISPHNGYVILMLRVGLFGVSVYIAALIYALSKGFFLLVAASHDDLFQQRRLAVAIIASQAIFSMGYLLPPEQGLLLALAFQTICGFSRSSVGTTRYLPKTLVRRRAGPVRRRTAFF